jgi:gliding motility-associated-like protein
VLNVHLEPAQQVILEGMSTQMNATTNSSLPIIHYIWSPGLDSNFNFINCTDSTDCSNPYVHPKYTTTFTVTVMNSDSCYASDTATVYVKAEPSAFIPSVFTPNGDNLNDRFEFDILGATSIEISIFNRWGERVYYNAAQANGMNGHNGWDGKVNGKDAPYDTYVYQMKVTYFDNSTQDRSGTVTILK